MALIEFLYPLIALNDGPPEHIHLLALPVSLRGLRGEHGDAGAAVDLESGRVGHRAVEHKLGKDLEEADGRLIGAKGHLQVGPFIPKISNEKDGLLHMKEYASDQSWMLVTDLS